MVDWNDNKKRKVLWKALEDVYPTEADLEAFTDYELDETLSVITSGDTTARGLMKWAKAKGKLDEVYEAFKADNTDNSVLDPVIETLERQDIVSSTSKLSQDDWDTLFSQFVSDDLADLRRAFFNGFDSAMPQSFKKARPDHPPLTKIAQIREWLETYDVDDDGPVLAVRFVECAISELQRTNSTDQRVTALDAWCNRITQDFNVPAPASSVQQTVGHAYLLVTLEEHGSDVNVYPELRIAGIEKGIRFGAKPETCPVEDVVNHIFRWIQQAEETSEIRQCLEEEVILELFLPCKHLAEDIAAAWTVKDGGDAEILLGTYRRFLIRSADRSLDHKIQKALAARWPLLESACSDAKNTHKKFLVQKECPEQAGTLSAILKDENTPGLKFVSQLPTDSSKRKSLIKGIIDAPIPIALWAADGEEFDPAILEAEFNNFIKECNLINFADLARRWRMQRTKNETKPERHIKLLCDRPDRWPRSHNIKHQENTDQEDSIAIVA